MKKWLLICAVLAAASLIVYKAQAAAPIGGKLLLQVQSKGEIWYSDPNDGKRYLLPPQADQALNMLVLQATLIDQRILAKIPVAGSKDKGDMNARRLYSGHILLSDGHLDRVWYVSPKDMKRYWFDGTDASYAYFKKLAVGILDKDLKTLPEGMVEMPAPATPSETATTTAMEEAPVQMPTTPAASVTGVKITTSTVMGEVTQESRVSVEVTFSSPVTKVGWYVFDTTPSSTQVWNQNYSFDYAENQTVFTLNGSNVQKGMSYTYMIMAQDKQTGLPVKYEGSFQL